MYDVLHLIDILRFLNDLGLLFFVDIAWNEKVFIPLPKGKVNYSKRNDA